MEKFIGVEMPDLLIIINSRSRADKLLSSIKQLYSTCNDPHNFQILCVVDNDQLEEYKCVKDYDFKSMSGNSKILWEHPPHEDGNWTHITKIQYKYSQLSYFTWIIPDDMFEIKDGWDTAILNKKEAHKDGIFTLAPDCNIKKNKRYKRIQEACYKKSEIKLNGLGHRGKEQKEFIRHYCELNPVYTKKWIHLMWDIFAEGNFTCQHDLISAVLAYVIYERYNTKRLLLAEGLEHKGVQNDGLTNKYTDDYGASKKESFEALCADDFLLLNSVIENFAKAIDNK